MEVRFAEAVEGTPGTTAAVPALEPSRVKVTVPEGYEAPSAVAVMMAETESTPPPVSEVDDGVMEMVVGLLGTVTVTEVACTDKLSPLTSTPAYLSSELHVLAVATSAALSAVSYKPVQIHTADGG